MAHTTSPGTGILALGDLDFGKASAPATTPGVHGAFRSILKRCGSLQTAHFEPLPATKREIDEIIDIWRHATDEDAVSLTGAGGTERVFQERAAGKRVIHLATHGFFLDGGCVSDALGGAGTNGDSPTGPGNPFLLSGLVFAGANLHEPGASVEGNGILTAEEIATLDLAGVEWAVLSACDTGVGVIQPGEGVLGLWRAFRVAACRP